MKADSGSCCLILIFLLCASSPGLCQSQADPAETHTLISTVQSLFASGHWAAVVDLTSSIPAVDPELDYYRGMALARLGRGQEARKAFELGRLRSPRDSRFPIELAGVMFKEGRRGEAKSYLEQALKLDSSDPYANDFLATLYFLDDNQEAAIKYWNRTGKPLIQRVTIDRGFRVDPVLLDHSLKFSPDALLTMRQYQGCQILVDSLGIFSSPRFRLLPRSDGTFDLDFHAFERNGSGGSWVERMVLLFRDVPFQTIDPEFFNFRGSAWNATSLFRWDAQKRRFLAVVSGPAGDNPGLHFRGWLDARRENWDVSAALREPVIGQNSFTMKTLEAGFEVQTSLGARTSVHNGLLVTERRFSGMSANQASQTGMFRPGAALEYDLKLEERWSVPERRFNVDSDTDMRAGRTVTSSDGPFWRFMQNLNWQWQPEAAGDDYRISGRLGAGTAAGPLPFDEFFGLGMDQDSDLFLRGHSLTENGKKGNGPLGRGFLLTNWQMDKLIRKTGFWKLSAGPFFDAGRTYDRASLFASTWLYDTGLEMRLTLFGHVTVILSYGRNLRGGNGLWFARVLR